MSMVVFKHTVANWQFFHLPYFSIMEWLLFAALSTLYYNTGNTPNSLSAFQVLDLWAGRLSNQISEWLREVHLSHSAFWGSDSLPGAMGAAALLCLAAQRRLGMRSEAWDGLARGGTIHAHAEAGHARQGVRTRQANSRKLKRPASLPSLPMIKPAFNYYPR
jgi:hypothetical protein